VLGVPHRNLAEYSVNLTVWLNAGAQVNIKIKTAATLNKQALFA
jgi:hypothetical protein